MQRYGAAVGSEWSKGRLPTGLPPDSGERFEVVLELPWASFEVITSSDRPEPARYDQVMDEWVVVLDGEAELRVDDEPVRLVSGEWLHLPAGTPHVVTHTAAGTRWLAVHQVRQGEAGSKVDRR